MNSLVEHGIFEIELGKSYHILVYLFTLTENLKEDKKYDRFPKHEFTRAHGTLIDIYHKNQGRVGLFG